MKTQSWNTRCFDVLTDRSAPVEVSQLHLHLGYSDVNSTNHILYPIEDRSILIYILFTEYIKKCTDSPPYEIHYIVSSDGNICSRTVQTTRFSYTTLKTVFLFYDCRSTSVPFGTSSLWTWLDKWRKSEQVCRSGIKNK